MVLSWYCEPLVCIAFESMLPITLKFKLVIRADICLTLNPCKKGLSWHNISSFVAAKDQLLPFTKGREHWLVPLLLSVLLLFLLLLLSLLLLLLLLLKRNTRPGFGGKLTQSKVRKGRG